MKNSISKSFRIGIGFRKWSVFLLPILLLCVCFFFFHSRKFVIIVGSNIFYQVFGRIESLSYENYGFYPLPFWFCSFCCCRCWSMISTVYSFIPPFSQHSYCVCTNWNFARTLWWNSIIKNYKKRLRRSSNLWITCSVLMINATLAIMYIHIINSTWTMLIQFTICVDIIITIILAAKMSWHKIAYNDPSGYFFSSFLCYCECMFFFVCGCCWCSLIIFLFLSLVAPPLCVRWL